MRIIINHVVGIQHLNMPLGCSFQRSRFSILGAILPFLVMLLLASSLACSLPANKSAGSPAMKEDCLMSLKLNSQAFDDGGLIPVKYTCDGEDISPSLSWSELSDGTRSLALIMDDPDAPAGTWVHWILYDLPPSSDGVDENMARSRDVPGGGSQGSNSWNRLGYGGPCPPSGTHRYIIRLYALDSVLALGPGAEKAKLVQAMEGHVLDRGQLLGLYSR